MRSSFTAMALAFAIVTMTALPAMAFTPDAKPVGDDEVGATPPEQLDSKMGLNTQQVGPDVNTQGVFPSENHPTQIPMPGVTRDEALDNALLGNGIMSNNFLVNKLLGNKLLGNS